MDKSYSSNKDKLPSKKERKRDRKKERQTEERKKERMKERKKERKEGKPWGFRPSLFNYRRWLSRGMTFRI